MKIFNSKKATMTAAGTGLIPAILTLVVVLLGILLPADLGEENKTAIIESVSTIIGIALTILLGSYNIGQGMADAGGLTTNGHTPR